MHGSIRSLQQIGLHKHIKKTFAIEDLCIDHDGLLTINRSGQKSGWMKKEFADAVASITTQVKASQAFTALKARITAYLTDTDHYPLVCLSQALQEIERGCRSVMHLEKTLRLFPEVLEFLDAGVASIYAFKECMKEPGPMPADRWERSGDAIGVQALLVDLEFEDFISGDNEFDLDEAYLRGGRVSSGREMVSEQEENGV